MSSKRSREETSWCTIESDPGIFTLLIEKLGVKGVQVEEIYDLESPKLNSVYGFIFLFKWSKQSESEGNFDECCKDIFFAQQEISNACATQAILHILLNSSVELGPVLENFKTFSAELPADMRGLCISNSLEIRQIHNEFGNLAETLAFEDDEEKEDEGQKDPFHFVAFIQNDGNVYELDGLKEFPILHAENVQNWEEKVLEIIKRRVNSSEIRFNLMAICADDREIIKAEISKLTQKLESDTESNSIESPEERTLLLTKRFKLEQDLEDEEAKWSRYRKNWETRQREHVKASTTKDLKLSLKVQNLLKSMATKGLIPKQ